MIKAQIICDSINPANVRLTTFVLTYPRFIHSEFMTHRAISKNAASSRAIPVEIMIESIRCETARPEYWAANQKGMQATAELDVAGKHAAHLVWNAARDHAVGWAESLLGIGCHKAIANRVLEPFAHMTVIATGDQFGWANLFALRAHPMAQQEFQVLAFRMLNAYMSGAPAPLEWGQWHLPYADDQDGLHSADMQLKFCTARCARVSLLNHEGRRSPIDDLNLHDKLRDARPVHASAFEHCAQACSAPTITAMRYGGSNFDGSWLQYRKTIPGESTRSLDLAATLASKPDWIAL